MSKQLDMLGGETSQKITRNKKQVDKRLADFYKRHTKALTPYAIVMTRSESDKPVISENHPLLSFTDAERHINAMCNSWGMTRTIANEGLVASGNGKYLYRLAYSGDSTPQRD